MGRASDVFVYGTLRKGERNHHLLNGVKCVAEQAWTAGKLFTTSEDYPVMQRYGSEKVYGELYEINDKLLERLDELEDFEPEREDNLYQRITQKVHTDRGDFLAYVYVISHRTKTIKQDLIQSGDWSVFQLLKNERFYYFAYGSCMDNVRFKAQDANQFFEKVIGRGMLDGYKLRYSMVLTDGGRADMVEEGGTVEGKLYEIDQAAIPYLYWREGVATGRYRPAIVPVRLDNGSIAAALTFLVVNKQAEVAPPAHYIEEILRGGKGCCSDAYLSGLAADVRELRKK
ncbi:gamma-glutamylcyclotransferase [Virgibacillus sp. 179-BFC.A HS]|uniref:Gamma-glutamylcyclotransferase family protein n=1 Tax=Tigheibacillus jepli TaxID=3035914 RepID=A0ABU5CL19_9BACI|nr:gamma-glutamylcyclotransferase family protein [Virgibacillus sp. 179-BFC.A HS]MDY0407057.1 gamma-glutamylcyclotransferase [Virgibacillus sp. 179-BFC.A HS]